MRRLAPRRLEGALARVSRDLAPATTLGRAQGAWERAVGAVVAAEAEPVSERDGVLTVSCSSSSWAQELSLLEADLRARLNAEIGLTERSGGVRELRFGAARRGARTRGRPR
jgi:predicted nucleic acid-binding Zn ribbon protein